MKRLTTWGPAAAVLLFAMTSIADAIRPPRLAEEAMAVEQAWTAWLLGGSNWLDDDFCGEVVDGRFFFMVGLSSAAPDLTCQIPAGMEAVVSPFRSFAWAPTHGKNGIKLFAAALDQLEGVVPKSVRVVVDGVRLPSEPLVCSHPFEIALQPDNLLQLFDPRVTGDSATVATCAWLHLVGPLSPGSHAIDVAATVQAPTIIPYSLHYDVTVA